MGRRPKNHVPLRKPVSFECVRCGANKPETEFYCNKQSRIYNIKKRVPLCKSCLHALYEEYSCKYGQEMAVFALCGTMDIPFLQEMCKKITGDSPPFTFGKYIKMLQLSQYKKMSFMDSIENKKPIEFKQTSAYSTSERLNRLQEEFSSLREELNDLKVNFATNGNIHR